MAKGNYWIITIFFITYIILCGLVIVFPYEYRDSDSSCYSSISQKLGHRPLREWCAPQWWGHGGNSGLFQDHPPGILWLPALFVRAGLPGRSAALCANFLYIFLSLYFAFLISDHFGNSTFGWAAVFAFVLTPIFLQYLLRANQEHPLNSAVLAGLYGLSRLEDSRRYSLLFVLALIFAIFIKGISALILVLLALLYWLIFFRKKRTLGVILLASLMALIAIGLFEIWYRNQTDGTSFWLNYLSFQGGKSVQWSFHPLHKVYNFLWYMARALWFPAPWFFFVIYGFYQSKKKELKLFRDKFFQFLIIGALLVILFFSFFDRKADRYIFPAYSFLVLAGVWVLFRLKSKILLFIQKKERLLPLYLSLILIVFTLLRIYFHTHHYRFIRFWSQ